MASEGKRDCYVFIQLPQSLEVVTCARYERERLADGRVVGRLVYGRSYRERDDAVALDPYHLPIANTTYETAKLQGVFGALRDAAPDAWGRRVIERTTAQTDFEEIDFLLHSPEDRAGALSFGRNANPPAPVHQFNRVLQLNELLRAVHLIEDDAPLDKISAQVQSLVSPGTSLGGARPKNVVEDDFGQWIAKFPQRSDRWNNALVEAAMLALAHLCGIRVPQTRIERVGSSSVLLVKRFDRERVDDGYLRHRMVSALTVLDAEDTATDRTHWSYVLLADELQRWSSRGKQDRAELFRRVVFNALISNTDDHPRNHALIAPSRDWQLAPAYDLTPDPLRSIERRDLAMVCGSFGRVARRDNLLSECERFGLQREDANAIIDEIRLVVASRWRAEVTGQGGTANDCDRIADAFAYEGFECTSAQTGG